MAEFEFPTATIDLPSRGWFYPKEHPLACGTIEMHYMTAKHEDILTSRNLIVKGTVIEKLMEALIGTPSVKYEDLLIGDRNQVLVAARILGYGKDYTATVKCPSCDNESSEEINLEDLKDKEIEFNPAQKGQNEFSFTLPICGKEITFKLFTVRDDINSRRELSSLKKITKGDVTSEVTTRMRQAILSVDGETDKTKIRSFIENMPARDARSFREHTALIMPDIDARFDFECSKCGHVDRLEVPISFEFFWPDSRV